MIHKNDLLYPGDSVLFIQLRAMGDTILTTPVIRDFKRAYPDVKLDFLVEPMPAQALCNNPHLHKLQILPTQYSDYSKYPSIIYNLRRAKYKIVIDFLSIPKSACLTFATDAKVRVGYKLRGRTWAYTHPIERSPEIIYSPLVKYNLVSLLNVSSSSHLPEIFPADEDYKWAQDRWFELDFDLNDTVFGIAPWSKREWRRWSMKAWLNVMDSIDPDGRNKWVLFAAESERPLLKTLEDTDRHVMHWAGAHNILRAAALMQRCKLLISAENGLMHVATAAGVPTLAIFLTTGNSPESWTPPQDPKHKFMIVDYDDDKLLLYADEAAELVTDLLEE